MYREQRSWKDYLLATPEVVARLWSSLGQLQPGDYFYRDKEGYLYVITRNDDTGLWGTLAGLSEE